LEYLLKEELEKPFAKFVARTQEPLERKLERKQQEKAHPYFEDGRTTLSGVARQSG
jgi:hypothetical protein